jgi:hypothetical protein
MLSIGEKMFEIDLEGKLGGFNSIWMQVSFTILAPTLVACRV